MRLFLALGVLFTVIGCTTVQSVSLTNYSPTAGKSLTHGETRWGFLHLTTPALDDMTEELLTKIQKYCSSGPLTNIRTTLSLHELFLAQLYDVQVTASCQAGTN